MRGRFHDFFCVLFSFMLHKESNLLPVLHFPALLLRLCYTQRLFCFLCCIFLLFYSAYATHRDCSAYCVAFSYCFAPPMLHTESNLLTVLHFPTVLLRLCYTQRLFCLLCCISLLFCSAYATHRSCFASCVAFLYSFNPHMLHIERNLLPV